MTAPKRYRFFAFSPYRKVVHTVFGSKTEGQRTECGAPMAAGWKWHSTMRGIADMKRCKSCTHEA